MCSCVCRDVYRYVHGLSFLGYQPPCFLRQGLPLARNSKTPMDSLACTFPKIGL